MTQPSDESANNPESLPVEPPFFPPERFEDITKSTLRAADGTPTFMVPAAQISDVMRFLRDEQGFSMLEDLTALDLYPAEPRFQVVYNLIALEKRAVIRIKVSISGVSPSITSITNIWPGANWYEREVFDLFGIDFEGHPDMRRIEMPDDWDGHPLRKDYPVTGPRRTAVPANWLRLEGRSAPPQEG